MAILPDFTLSDGEQFWDCILDGPFNISTISEDRAALDLRANGKKIGEFDEQKDWKAGRGAEYLLDSPNGYYDGQFPWSLNSNILLSGLQHAWGKGLHAGEDLTLPGSVSWVPLYAGASGTNAIRYIDRRFQASSTYNAERIGLWIKRVGKPGTLTVELCSNNSGDPGSVLKTVTIFQANVADVISVYREFVFSSVQALTSGVVYHIKVYGDSTDNSASHWEIAIDTSGNLCKTSPDNSTWTASAYGFYYRVTDPDISRRLWMFQYDGALYAVTQNYDLSASKLFINGDRGKATSGSTTSLTNTNASFANFAGAYCRFLRGKGAGQVATIASNTSTVLTFSPAVWVAPDSTTEYVIYYTDIWKELTGHGLGVVTGRPVVCGTIVYFPQGTTAMRKMYFNASASPPVHTYAADGTNTAYLLTVGTDTTGPKIWASDGGASLKKASAVAAFATNLTFGSAVTVGDATETTTSLLWATNVLYVFKEASTWQVGIDGKPVLVEWGFKYSPSRYNGAASVAGSGFIYTSWLHSLKRIYGTTVDDVGISFRGTGIKSDKQGYFAAMTMAMEWVFCAIYSVASTSSVNVYDGMGFHEIYQAPTTGKPILDVWWQACEGSNFNRLWIDVAGYAVYIDFPAFTNHPYYATGTRYQHETVIESAIVDMGTSARLPKFIKDLTAVTENLSAAGRYISVDYQVDSQIFTSTWIRAGRLNVSPESTIPIGAANVRRFRYRLRMCTNSNTTPIVVRSVVPSGFARVPYKLSWALRIKLDKLKVTGSRDPTDFFKWLLEASQKPGKMRITSERYPTLNNYLVTLAPPLVVPKGPQRSEAKGWKGVATITLQQI